MLIHLICLFGDGFDILRLKTNEHSFKAHLLTKYATSKTEHEPQGDASDMHASVRDIVAYGNSDICALRK